MDEQLDTWDNAPRSPYGPLCAPLPPKRTIPTIELMRERYANAKASKTGAECVCPSCGTVYAKKSYQQAFCSNKGRGNCKDHYHNTVIPGRNRLSW